ncbi:hypothetical protein PTI98_011587 [Pleurotus ostreatus]|nr:hypothetical protein PTI98_011587 [Pleurotus ostreatus]
MLSIYDISEAPEPALPASSLIPIMPAELPYNVPWATHPLSKREAYDVDIDILTQNFTSFAIRDVPKTPSVPGAYPETPHIDPRAKKIINFLSLYSENNREMVERCAQQLGEVTDPYTFEKKAFNALSLLVADGDTAALKEPAKHLRELLFGAKKVRFAHAPPDDDVFGAPSDAAKPAKPEAKDVQVKMEPSSSPYISPQVTEHPDSRGPRETENQHAPTPAVSVSVAPPHVPTNPRPNPLPRESQDAPVHPAPSHHVHPAPSHHAPTNYDGREYTTIPQPASSSQIPVAQPSIPPDTPVPPPHIPINYDGREYTTIPQPASLSQIPVAQPSIPPDTPVLPPHVPTNSNDVKRRHADSSQIPIAQAPTTPSHPQYSQLQGPIQYPTFQTQASNISQVPPPPGPTTYTYMPFGAPGSIPQHEPQGPPHVWQQYHYPGGYASPPPQSQQGYYSVDTSAPQDAATRYYNPPPAIPEPIFESASTPRPAPRHTSAPPPVIQVQPTSYESVSTPARRHVSAPPSSASRGNRLYTSQAQSAVVEVVGI